MEFENLTTLTFALLLSVAIFGAFKVGQIYERTSLSQQAHVLDLQLEKLKQKVELKLEVLWRQTNENMELAEGLRFKDIVQDSLIMEADSIPERILGLNKIYLDLVTNGTSSSYFVYIIDTYGIRGILLNRRNILIMSMPIESMLLAVNSNFLVFSVSSDDMMGQSFASLVSTVAAAESAIGLAIFVITFRVRGTIAVESINSIQGSGKMLFAAILSICASSSKKISIYNEEMIVARCFIGFILFSRKSLGKTFKMTLDGRIQAIQEESQQFPNPNEVVPPESNEQERLLRISLRICGTVVESLPMARCAPKCEKTVQAFLCRNLNVKSATLPNATSSRRIRLQDDLVTGFRFSVSERFVPGSTLKVSIVELIREGLGVLKMVRVGGSLKNKENE
ncbi:hypothetical protein OROMI_032864 [Orobanche minor]